MVEKLYQISKNVWCDFWQKSKWYKTFGIMSCIRLCSFVLFLCKDDVCKFQEFRMANYSWSWCHSATYWCCSNMTPNFACSFRHDTCMSISFLRNQGHPDTMHCRVAGLCRQWMVEEPDLLCFQLCNLWSALYLWYDLVTWIYEETCHVFTEDMFERPFPLIDLDSWSDLLSGVVSLTAALAL